MHSLLQQEHLTTLAVVELLVLLGDDVVGLGLELEISAGPVGLLDGGQIVGVFVLWIGFRGVELVPLSLPRLPFSALLGVLAVAHELSLGIDLLLLLLVGDVFPKTLTRGETCPRAGARSLALKLGGVASLDVRAKIVAELGHPEAGHREGASARSERSQHHPL